MKQGKRLTRKLLDRYCGPIVMKQSLKWVDAPELFHRLIYKDVLACEFRGTHGIYKVHLKIGEDELEGNCTCPIDKPFCEHVAALGNTWIEVPESFQSVDEIEPKFKKKSQEELIEIIIRMILLSPIVLGILGIEGFGPTKLSDDGELGSGEDDIFALTYHDEDESDDELTEFTEEEEFEEDEFNDFYGEDYEQ